MKFDPFIAQAIMSQPAGQVWFDRPVQLSLLPECQLGLRYALRKHHAARLHFDLRIQVFQTLFSFALPQIPSLDPSKSVQAILMGDHDPRYLESERLVPADMKGGGPMMPVDLGRITPLLRTYETIELEALDQIGRGDFRFRIDGVFLQGGWLLKQASRQYWKFQKLDDEHASTTRVLQLDRSVITGKTLDDIRREGKEGRGQS